LKRPSKQQIAEIRETATKHKIVSNLLLLAEIDALHAEHADGCRCPECDPDFNDPRNVSGE
jgi:hypothetical protein